MHQRSVREQQSIAITMTLIQAVLNTNHLQLDGMECKETSVICQN